MLCFNFIMKLNPIIYLKFNTITWIRICTAIWDADNFYILLDDLMSVA